MSLAGIQELNVLVDYRVLANVKIGNRMTFRNDCVFGVAGGIEIGDDVVAGQFIWFRSENHKYNDMTILIREQGVTHKGIKIGDNCWIGAGAVFLDGASVGNGCVVGANAVITKEFPENVVIAGYSSKNYCSARIKGEDLLQSIEHIRV